MIFKMEPKAGEHVELNRDGTSVTYKAGDVVESDTDLVKRFPNKFVRLDVELVPGGNVPQPYVPVPHRFIKDPETPEPTETLDETPEPTETLDETPEPTEIPKKD